MRQSLGGSTPQRLGSLVHIPVFPPRVVAVILTSISLTLPSHQVVPLLPDLAVISAPRAIVVLTSAPFRAASPADMMPCVYGLIGV